MNEIEEIKSRLNVADLIGQYLTLKKAGTNFKTNCPFHQEKSPSFMVSPEKQIWKCFGCGKGGDIFEFIMEMEGLNFREALELLANRAGVELKTTKTKQEYTQEKDTKTKIYQINKLSAQVFAKILLASNIGKKALDYLKDRGLKIDTIKNFEIGFAPANNILEDFLFKRGFNKSDLRQAGGPERFQNRIMFPIFDIMGNVVGFSGRALNKGQEPKYINTPETPIYYKSRVLYGLDKARQEIKLQNKSLVVEGQMDVVMSHQAGVKIAVASSGTALTREHLAILARYSENIIFAFDQDQAGKEATKKSLKLVIGQDMNVKIVVLPNAFKDAGEAIAKDENIWVEAVDKALPAIEWYFKLAFDQFSSDKNLTAEDKKKIAKEILPVINIVPNEIEKSHYIQLLAKKLQVDQKIIEQVLEKIKTGAPRDEKTSVQTINKKNIDTEELLLTLLIKFPNLVEKTVSIIDYKDLKDGSETQRIYKLMQSCYTKGSCSEKQANCDFSKNFTICLNKNITESAKNKIQENLLTLEELYQSPDEVLIEQEVNQCIGLISSRKKEDIKEEFSKLIRAAEDKGDREEIKRLMIKLQKLMN